MAVIEIRPHLSRDPGTPPPGAAPQLALDETRPLQVRAVQGAHLTDEDAKIVCEINRHLDARGRCSATDFLEVCRDPDSLGHRLFIWDDQAAAEVQRLSHARFLMRSFEINVAPVDKEPEWVRGALTSRYELTGETELKDALESISYIPILRVAENPYLALQVIRTARRHLRAVYRSLQSVERYLGEKAPRLQQLLSDLDRELQ